jgi:vancomycin resistance protein YoaR
MQLISHNILAALLLAGAVLPASSHAEDFGVLISERSSEFKSFGGGYSNRAHNIARASGKLNGLVVEGGQEISFNSVVGPRDKDSGYKISKAIQNGKMIKDYGGGVCQVAGTLYFTLEYVGGVKFLEHHYHSRKSSYLDLGHDATVSWSDKKDLRFKNEFSFPIMIKTHIEKLDKFNSRIIFQVYGKQRLYDVEVVSDIFYRLKFKKITEVSTNPNQKRKIVVEAGVDGFHIRKTTTVKSVETGEVVTTFLEKIDYPVVNELISIPETDK